MTGEGGGERCKTGQGNGTFTVCKILDILDYYFCTTKKRNQKNLKIKKRKEKGKYNIVTWFYTKDLFLFYFFLKKIFQLK